MLFNFETLCLCFIWIYRFSFHVFNIKLIKLLQASYIHIVNRNLAQLVTIELMTLNKVLSKIPPWATTFINLLLTKLKTFLEFRSKYVQYFLRGHPYIMQSKQGEGYQTNDFLLWGTFTKFSDNHFLIEELPIPSLTCTVMSLTLSNPLPHSVPSLILSEHLWPQKWTGTDTMFDFRPTHHQ